MAKAATTTGKKAASNKTAQADAAASAEDEEAAAAEKAQADAAEKEAKDAALLDLRGRMTDTLTALTEADTESAIEARAKWVEIGDLLREGRNLFTKPGKNEPNDVAFGRWIEREGFKALGARPTRAAAIWLSETFHLNRSLYDLFPTESKNGEPLRRSPRTLKDWVRDQAYHAFQVAWEEDSDGVQVASEMDDKAARADIAKESMPNVFDVMDTIIGKAEDDVATKQKALNAAKKAEDQQKAFDAYRAACDHRDEATNVKDVVSAIAQEDLLSLFVGWKPKVAAVAFKDTDIDDAAQRIFVMLKGHAEFGAVYDRLGELVSAHQSKLAADAKAVDPEEDDEFAEEKARDAAEFDDVPGEFDDVDGDDADALDDDADADDDDMDDGFDDDADANFADDEDGDEA